MNERNLRNTEANSGANLDDEEETVSTLSAGAEAWNNLTPGEAVTVRGVPCIIHQIDAKRMILRPS